MSDLYLASLCVYSIQGKRLPMWQSYHSISWFRMYNKYLVQMGLKEDSRSHKKNMLTRQGRAERGADHQVLVSCDSWMRGLTRKGSGLVL